MTLFLEVVAVAAAVVGGLVLLLWLLGWPKE
jgi:hypothetical protein